MTYVQIALNGLLLGGFYLLMAQGLNLVVGVMKIVNIAHGAFAVVAGLAVNDLYRYHGINPLLSLPIVAIVGFVGGAVVQWILVERIGGANQHQKVLLTVTATFGLSYILINLAQQAFGGDFASVPYLTRALKVGSLRFPESLLVGFGLAAVLTAVLSAWLRNSRSGTALRATSQSEIGSASCGINARMIRVLGFGLGAALAATAGALLVIIQPIAPAEATSFTLLGFVVIALGGLGNYAGAALGAAIVGVGQTFAGYQFGSIAEAAVPYVLLILVMLVRPAGLLRAKS